MKAEIRMKEIYDLLHKRWDEVSPSEIESCNRLGFTPRVSDPIVRVTEPPGGLDFIPLPEKWEVGIFQRSREGELYQVRAGRVWIFPIYAGSPFFP